MVTENETGIPTGTNFDWNDNRQSWDPLMGIVQATAFRGRASSSRLPDRFLSSWNDLLGEDTNLALFLSFRGGPEDECIQSQVFVGGDKPVYPVRDGADKRPLFMEEEWFLFRRLRPLLIIDHADNLSDSFNRFWGSTVLLCRPVDKSLSSPYLVAGSVGTERIDPAIR
jgi:hypothetical protein